MTKRPKLIAILAFIVAFLAPVWASLLLAELSRDPSNYDSMGIVFLGFFNLMFIIPSLTFLFLGRKNPKNYRVSIILSVISIIFVCVMVFGR